MIARNLIRSRLRIALRIPTKIDNSYSTRWQLIKSGFSHQLPKYEHITESRQSKGERGIWQRRYWEHLIRDDGDYERHANYIHYIGEIAELELFYKESMPDSIVYRKEIMSIVIVAINKFARMNNILFNLVCTRLDALYKEYNEYIIKGIHKPQKTRKLIPPSFISPVALLRW